jgi:cysteine desulfurase
VTAYLDHAATTPMLPEAIAAWADEAARVGNASSLHTAGRHARRVVEESREALAAVLGATPAEVVFTGGGTEADNLAVKGLYWARRAEDDRRRRVLVSAVEHHAVLDPASGWPSTRVPRSWCYRSTSSAGSTSTRCGPRSRPTPRAWPWSR